MPFKVGLSALKSHNFNKKQHLLSHKNTNLLTLLKPLLKIAL
jgi:hypothetical protein